MIEKILIANRGEIACRIMRTARRLGIRTVAVYSDADTNSRHVQLADEAKHIGGARASDSYLNINSIVEAIRDTGADAVHPGYGFLSENAEFAENCVAEGTIFIGPPPSAIKAMGSKSEAKRLMELAGVPLLPGYHGSDQSDETLIAAAEQIGFPVMVKAAAGGGGRGMRMVETVETLAADLAAARREAQAGFGNDLLLIEKYLRKPRHIEMQIFADSFGKILHIFERDCSIQRRHQKVVEEAPAPGMTNEMRKAMANSAVKAASAIDYVGAGTVEFLVEANRMGLPDCFYFMEMNTRLQVEHPVSEMITGIDLVEWQIRVAEGLPLTVNQKDILIDGHAIEVRLYAENPEKSFRPSPGPISSFRMPMDGLNLRIDCGVSEGEMVSMHYDPMIAKIIGWDSNRQGAINRLRRGLEDTQIVGITTNLNFLAAVISNESFSNADLDTGFIDRHLETLLAEVPGTDSLMLSLVSLAELIWRRESVLAQAVQSADPYSPWQQADCWDLNDRGHIALCLREGEVEVVVVARLREDGYNLKIEGSSIDARGCFLDDGRLTADINGHRVTVSVVRYGPCLYVAGLGKTRKFEIVDPLIPQGIGQSSGGRLTSPLPGRIVSVTVGVGDVVSMGQVLMVIEAMKMEHAIVAPAAGRVEIINFKEGDQVDEGKELLGLAAN